MNSTVEQWYAAHRARVDRLATDIFEHPETAAQEAFACRATAAFLEEFGFAVQKITVPPAAVENGVVAKWGGGKPVIGILGEYDALPGLGQDAVPYRSPRPGPGHGCGHCLMNAGCASGAAALKAAMEAEGLPGTIVYLACPAEEGLSGKVHMLADGWFDGIDLCIAWHDGGPFRVAEHVNQAMVSVEFLFRGKTAHAACSPQEGRSALDAAQLMNMGVEFLREHVEDAVRVHYVFGGGGERPNVVPDYASLKYYVRSYDRQSVDAVFRRVCDIAKGAALMTGTQASYRLVGGGYEPLLNFTLNRALYGAAQKVPDIVYDAGDQAFARELYRNYNGAEAPEQLDLGDRAAVYGACGVLPTHFCKLLGHGWPEFGSTDVNDVSQVIPTVQLFGGGVMGVGGHSWGVTASSGSPAGRKAAVQAGKYIAQFCLDVFHDPAIAEKSKAELAEQRRHLPPYEPLLATGEEVAL